MSQQDKAELRTERAHSLSHGLKRNKPHRAVIKGRKKVKKRASRAQRRVDKAATTSE